MRGDRDAVHMRERALTDQARNPLLRQLPRAVLLHQPSRCHRQGLTRRLLAQRPHARHRLLRPRGIPH
eukprot:308171-Rhodomonas_salina.6